MKSWEITFSSTAAATRKLTRKEFNRKLRSARYIWIVTALLLLTACDRSGVEGVTFISADRYIYPDRMYLIEREGPEGGPYRVHAMSLPEEKCNRVAAEYNLLVKGNQQKFFCVTGAVLKGSQYGKNL